MHFSLTDKPTKSKQKFNSIINQCIKVKKDGISHNTEFLIPEIRTIKYLAVHIPQTLPSSCFRPCYAEIFYLLKFLQQIIIFSSCVISWKI